MNRSSKKHHYSERNGESFGFGKGSLAIVEGEQACHAEMDGGGDVEDDFGLRISHPGV
jgi:hypothetical protein